MNPDDIQIPLYLITGFLESGKTSFLNFTMRQDYFQIDEKTLLICCEEGEISYDPERLLEWNTVLEVIEDQDDFTFETLRTLHRRHRPARVILEFNPLWGVRELEEMRLPLGWGIVQEIVTVDAGTFQLYMTNMKSLFVDMTRNADMVLFNRCEDSMALPNFRRSIKVVNPGCDVQFMNLEGRPVDIFSDEVPYDLDQNVIEIEDMDFGIFYVDMRDNPERYLHKKVKFKGRVLKSRNMGADYFVPARPAMTCCADDIQYIGYICRSKNAPGLAEGSWVEVTAKVDWKFVPAAGQEEPVLQAVTISGCQAPDPEMVYFN